MERFGERVNNQVAVQMDNLLAQGGDHVRNMLFNQFQQAMEPTPETAPPPGLPPPTQEGEHSVAAGSGSVLSDHLSRAQASREQVEDR